MNLLTNIEGLLGPADSAVRLKHNEDLLTSLLNMAWMVEARDPYTGGHLWRVSQLSRMVAT
jgi:HD-GYP domain-containing protein (c-di-GMP phosphodiesterase class II)